MQSVSKSPERQYSVDEGRRVDSPELRIAPIGAANVEKAGEVYRIGNRAATVSTGGKILTVNVSHPNPSATQGNMSPRRMVPSASPGGRGTPPPLPPNKPSIASPTQLQQSPKPALPAKVGAALVAKDRGVILTGQESPNMTPRGIHKTGQESPNMTPRGIHIPVSVVHSSGAVIPSGKGSTGAEKTSSPLRKPAQVCVNAK